MSVSFALLNYVFVKIRIHVRIISFNPHKYSVKKKNDNFLMNKIGHSSSYRALCKLVYVNIPSTVSGIEQLLIMC